MKKYESNIQSAWHEIHGTDSRSGRRNNIKARVLAGSRGGFSQCDTNTRHYFQGDTPTPTIRIRWHSYIHYYSQGDTDTSTSRHVTTGKVRPSTQCI
ncbi:hypothetical protein E2C01_031705 [Portunus trituberculatus]|uniref:Uncharacterized protein n=1 Tax=Portunus trituberculatus TaxID=210409 RepID=A0A5B7EU67_PORTR|nr:hypothetical protein [Portunus trituberculatus]